MLSRQRSLGAADPKSGEPGFELLYHPPRDIDQFHVCFLRCLQQHLEYGQLVNAVAVHQDSLRLPDDVTACQCFWKSDAAVAPAMGAEAC
jgi:hypothetical protein